MSFITGLKDGVKDGIEVLKMTKEDVGYLIGSVGVALLAVIIIVAIVVIPLYILK